MSGVLPIMDWCDQTDKESTSIESSDHPAPKKQPVQEKVITYKNSIIVPEWSISENDKTADIQAAAASTATNGKNNPDVHRIPAVCVMKNDDYFSYTNPPAANDFDCLRYLKFQEIRSKLFAARRKEGIRHGFLQPKDMKVKDSDILKEMISTYGEMDMKSERFKKLFETYKESYLEDLEECRQEESEMVSKIIASGASVIDHSFECTTEIYEEIRKYFTPQEIEVYGNLDPATNASGADWLDLPRPRARWGKTVVREVKELKYKDHNKGENLVMNLNVMDPRYHKFPRYTNSNDTETMGLAICRSLNNLMHNFPAGITPDVFWERFYDQFKYRIDLRGENEYGFNCLNEIFPSLSDVFCTTSPFVKNKKSVLVFPRSLQSQVDCINMVNKKLRHFILLTLIWSGGFILIEDILQAVVRFWGVKINYYDWGFQSVNEFMEIYVRKNSDCVNLVSIRISDEKQETLEYYMLVINAPIYMDIFNLHKSMIEKTDLLNLAFLNKKIIPEGFMKIYNGQSMEHVADRIKPGSVYSCFSTGVCSPSKFGVILKTNWNHFERFQFYVQDDKWRIKLNQKMDREVEINMARGTYVLCYHNSNMSKAGKEWYRGQILEYRESKNKYRVRLLDYGKEVFEPFESLRYCPMELVQDEGAQTIMCQLRMSQKFDKYRTKAYWTDKHRQLFKNLMAKGDVFVKFHSKTFNERMNVPVWEVTMSILGSERDELLKNKVIIPNVAEAIENECLEQGLETGQVACFKPIELGKLDKKLCFVL